ncbi:uncharacterized protein BO72DRAFT_529033 [Aspergillus fijiensis CBS 313.89]|uniref:F-box domain-containing protein n=1 Tax=Aspergillus fijiensis CBS 313.89 TaxID=1448319 RepID=A0A8G1RKK2_9EURO|nr:uncharacterized protein BO72DRAFT_529033 [Aspergillus fijiensis CBS 313.89]RAK75712.1 hypothetical protein BO72DRAFT_529033 [Aspergillus fijiensis CBS 313.89]
MHLPPSNHAFLPFFGLHKQSTISTSSRSRPETPTMSLGTSMIDEQVECAAEHATKNVDSRGVHESTNSGISNPSESMLSRFELLPAELLLSVKGFLGNTDAIHLGMCSQTLRKKVRQSPSTEELNKAHISTPTQSKLETAIIWLGVFHPEIEILRLTYLVLRDCTRSLPEPPSSEGARVTLLRTMIKIQKAQLRLDEESLRRLRELVQVNQRQSAQLDEIIRLLRAALDGRDTVSEAGGLR